MDPGFGQGAVAWPPTSGGSGPRPHPQRRPARSPRRGRLCAPVRRPGRGREGSSFWRTWVTCVLTVVSLMKSSCPISAFDRPRAIRRKTSSSRVGEVVQARRRRRTGSAREPLDDAPGHRRREQCVARRHRSDCRQQLLGRIVLQHEAAGPRRQGLDDVLVEVERREDDDPSPAVGSDDPPGRLDAVELWHADVHQDHRRIEASRLLDRLEAIRGLRDDRDVRLLGQQHAEARPDQRLVVGHEHADAHGPRPRAGSVR